MKNAEFVFYEERSNVDFSKKLIACLVCVLADKEQVRMEIVCLKVTNSFDIDGESKIALCS